MSQHSHQKGFTLIELLVVIAIIGLLASIVLASLGSARTGAQDAAVKTQVSQFRTLYELEMINSGSYAALKGGWRTSAASCTFSGSYASQAQAICTALYNIVSGCGVNCIFIGNTNPNYSNTYTIMTFLPGAKQWFCMGSSGRNYTGPSSGWSGSGCYANP